LLRSSIGQSGDSKQEKAPKDKDGNDNARKKSKPD